jgi:hypothetical protein
MAYLNQESARELKNDIVKFVQAHERPAVITP